MQVIIRLRKLLFCCIVLFVHCNNNDLAQGESSNPNLQTAPNVIFVLTDDQGIGDLGCQGNPWLKTPHLDAFYEDAIRMTDYHVSPYCTPTRSAVMTGLYPINNGAWATYKGRAALSKGAVTMADIFKNNGYKTALFGKWHLGDNYPSRPTDCGFDVAVQHLSGGVGELSDYWGNSYFDDTYYVNNEPKPFKGYCTDVWFDEAIKYMDGSDNEPFFIYLPTNAPHTPLIVDEKYAAPYKHLEGKEIISADHFGMLANIDENFGKLTKYLEDSGKAQNTIVIFMGDNGSNYGTSRDGKIGYNKGFRGIKGSKLEGGHRVPFFIRWPERMLDGGKDVNVLTTHVDLIPTLSGLCKLDLSAATSFDGIDFSPVLLQQKESLGGRTVFVHHRQDWRPPMDTDGSCIMMDQWRFLNGKELYDIKKDPMQQNNIAAQHPEIVNQLLASNRTFLQASKKNVVYDELPANVVGNGAQQEITLTIQHAIGEDKGIWKCEQVAAGMTNSNNTHVLDIESDGEYLISCRRWPKECPGLILGVPKLNPKNMFDYKTIRPDKVRIEIEDQILEQEISNDAEAITFNVNLKKGRTKLVNDFIEGDEKYGVYYTYVKKAE